MTMLPDPCVRRVGRTALEIQHSVHGFRDRMPVEAHDPGSLGLEERDHRGTNASCRARNNCDLVTQPVRHAFFLNRVRYRSRNLIIAGFASSIFFCGRRRLIAGIGRSPKQTSIP